MPGCSTLLKTSNRTLPQGTPPPRAAQHRKLLVFDCREFFVGSMNLDPRSAHGVVSPDADGGRAVRHLARQDLLRELAVTDRLRVTACALAGLECLERCDAMGKLLYTCPGAREVP